MASPHQFLFHKTVKGKIEFRIDPLTKQQTRINPDRATRPKQGESDSTFESVVKSSQERCPFCPERIFEKVPKFSENISKEGRFIKGQTVIFPNLNPFGENHAVGVIADAHYLDIEQFSTTLLSDTIVASQNYIQAVHASKPTDKYPVFVWNYLPPSAGSIIHPHIQILVEEEPVPELQKHLTNSSDYFKTNSRNFYSDLVIAELKSGERYIGGNDSVHVITSFAPRGFNEVQFIFPHVSSFTSLNKKQVDHFVEALVKILAGYKSVGVGSFNLASYSAAVNENRDDYWLCIKLFSRPFPKGVYTNDTGPMERMYDSFVIDSPPEILASNLRPFFNK